MIETIQTVYSKAYDMTLSESVRKYCIQRGMLGVYEQIYVFMDTNCMDGDVFNG